MTMTQALLDMWPAIAILAYPMVILLALLTAAMRMAAKDGQSKVSRIEVVDKDGRLYVS